MAGRKSLNDVLRGDRADIRKAHVGHQDDWGFSGGKFHGKHHGNHQAHTGSCYMSHPPLKLPGTEFVIYGGSGITPAVPDADIYISFEGHPGDKAFYPWLKKVDLLYPIPDMGAPKNPASFKAMVSWVKEQIEAGKKVHVGCIGGHGRTGTFLSALVSMYGEADAISYVRTNYCERVVESSAQVHFLQDHFGVTPVGGSKSNSTGHSPPRKKIGKKSADVVELHEGGPARVSHLPHHGSIWVKER